MAGDVCYSFNLTLYKYQDEENNFAVKSLLINENFNESLLPMSRPVVGGLYPRYHWRKSHQSHSAHVTSMETFALH